MKEFVAIIQAREGSKRFPKKVLKNIYDNNNSLDLIHKRLSRSELLDEIVFAVPEKDKTLINYLKSKNYKFCCGEEQNVSKRYLDSAKDFDVKNIVRITSDCPLVDPKIVDDCISKFNKYDYVSNNTPPEISDFANGSDVEIFSKLLLEKINKKFPALKDKEHVTFPMWDGRYKLKSLRLKKEISDKKIRITLDHFEDLEVIKRILDYSQNLFIEYEQIISIYKLLKLSQINGKFEYDEGWK